METKPRACSARGGSALGASHEDEQMRRAGLHRADAVIRGVSDRVAPKKRAHDYQEVVYAFGFAVNMLQYWIYV